MNFQTHKCNIITHSNIFSYWLQGCDVGERPIFLTVFVRGLLALWVFISRSLDEFVSSSPTNDGIREVCNLGNSTLLFDSLKLFSHKLNISVELAIGMLAPFECTNFNPVYGDLVYESTFVYKWWTVDRMCVWSYLTHIFIILYMLPLRFLSCMQPRIWCYGRDISIPLYSHCVLHDFGHFAGCLVWQYQGWNDRKWQPLR